jgi:membrane protease YdiL (CAAX protease family)
MKQNIIQTQNRSSQPGALVISKAILIGFLVSGIGVSAWSLLFSRVAAPWSAISMVAVLYVYWKLFCGKWGRVGAQSRKENFRSQKLTAKVWIWGLAAAACFVVVVQSSFVITFRIFEFPAKRFTADYRILDHMPLWSAWLAIVMGSVVAGICEETGFRGYMQVPIEKKYAHLLFRISFSQAYCLAYWHSTPDL